MKTMRTPGLLVKVVGLPPRATRTDVLNSLKCVLPKEQLPVVELSARCPFSSPSNSDQTQFRTEGGSIAVEEGAGVSAAN